MESDEQALRALNVRIGRLESAAAGEGEAAKKAGKALEDIIAPVLAFRRANGSLADWNQFIHPTETNASPRETEVISVSLYGERAVVECIVTMGENRYHNLRLFIRHDEQWRLLGWANEPMAAAPASSPPS